MRRASHPLHDGFKPIPGSVLPSTADEFRAVVSLAPEPFHFDADGPEVAQEQADQEVGIGGALFLAIGQKHHAAADLAGGKLVSRQAQGLSLRPGMEDIAKVLGIHGNLSEELPGRFDLGQVLFLFVLFSSFLNESAVSQDAADDLMGAGQAMLPAQAAGTHEGELFSQRNDFSFEGGVDLVGAAGMLGSSSNPAGRSCRYRWSHF